MTKIRIDASSLKLSSCFRRLYWTVVEGYREKRLGNSMVYGLAYHRFIETLSKTGDLNQATCKAIKFFLDANPQIESRKDWLNANHLANTLNEYASQFGNQVTRNDFILARTSDGEILVEKNFEIPLVGTETHSVVLNGTIDETGKFKHGTHAIADHKVTAAWNHDDYFQNYRLSPQLITYVWAIHKFAKIYPGSVWEELCSQRLGAFIKGVFISSKKPTEWKQSDVIFFTEEQLEAYEYHLYRVARKLLDLVINFSKEDPNFVPMPEGMFNGSCTQHFGEVEKKCKFFNICAAPSREASDAMLENCFDKLEYNPLMFSKK